MVEHRSRALHCGLKSHLRWLSLKANLGFVLYCVALPSNGIFEFVQIIVIVQYYMLKCVLRIG